MSGSKRAKTPELLAPAGNLETALAAYDAGADAIYCGLDRFNARERAENLTFDSLSRLLEYARSRGRKLYLALNTLVKEDELSEVAKYLAELAKLAPDALIVQDLGVLALARELSPLLALHASTQMGIHNSAGVAAAARLGIRRVILERQLALEELRAIAERSEIELEVFIHGSLCCSLSGQCLLSSATGGGSGNRGKCKQLCRRRYEINGRRGFFLSPRDLYGVPLLPELRRIGVASVKIEGRLRSPDYVWKTVRAYRLLLDGPIEPPPELLAEAEQLLRSTAMRRASNGFFFPHEYRSLIDAGRLGSFGTVAGRVEKRVSSGIEISAIEKLHLGDRLRLIPPAGGDGESFTLISLRNRGREAVKVRPGTHCFIPGVYTARPGWLLCKIGENGYDFSRQAASLPAGRRPLKLSLHLGASKWIASIAELPGTMWEREVEFLPARIRPFAAETARKEFASAVPEPWSAPDIVVKVEGAFFVPASVLKTLRREFWEWAKERLKPELADAASPATPVQLARATTAPAKPAAAWEPTEEAFELPSFVPESELAELRKKLCAAYGMEVRTFRVGGLYGFELLRNLPADCRIVAVFPLPVCNSMAAKELQSCGAVAVEPFAELDQAAYEAFRMNSPLPFAEPRHGGRPPVLATRLPLPDDGVWIDGHGRRFHVRRAGEISRLLPDFPPKFRKREWL